MNFGDPSEFLCQYSYSFVDRLSEITPNILPRAYPTTAFPVSNRTRITKIRKSPEKVFGTVSIIFKQENIQVANVTNLPPIKDYVDLKAYTELQTIKNQYNHPDYIGARNLTNPFEHIGNSIFMNRAAIKLSNIDAIYNVSQNFADYRNYREDGKLSFADLAGAPGGFVQYLQFRFTQSFGFGISV